MPSPSVSKMRLTRDGEVEVTIRATPEKRGQQPHARIVGRVRDGKLVTANGIKWTFR